jgi:hypothetical protein
MVYAAEELQNYVPLLKEAAGQLRQALKYLSLEKRRASVLGYLKEQFCSEARLEIEHRRIADA